MYYWFDWGDGTNTGWIGPYQSGETCNASHSWEKKGDYVIKVKARDRCYAESNWTTLSISMPKDKLINRPFLRFINNHQNLLPFLQKLLMLLDSLKS